MANKDQILRQIRDRIRDHNFAGEILDDAWAEHVTPRAVEYLTPEEIDALDEVDEEAITEGAEVILDEFLRWMALQGIR